MLKLTHIAWPGIGGHFRELQAFMRCAGPLSLDISIVFWGNQPPTPEIETECARYGVPYQYVDKPKGWGLGSCLNVLRALVCFRPDVIIPHGAQIVLVAKLYQIIFGGTIITVETQANALKTAREVWLSQISMLLSDRIVCLCDAYAAELSQICKKCYRESKVTVIPNGVDLEVFAPELRPSTEDVFILGMHSRLVLWKDHRTLFYAMALLKEDKVRLRIAGDGFELKSLMTLADDLGISNSVEFLGALSTNEVVDMLRSLDLYVHCTHGESYCFSIMEALATGKAVVTSKVPVLNSTLSELDFVFFHEPRSPESLASEIKRLVETRERLPGLAMAAREYAQRALDDRVMIRNYLELIGRVPGRCDVRRLSKVQELKTFVKSRCPLATKMYCRARAYIKARRLRNEAPANVFGEL